MIKKKSYHMDKQAGNSFYNNNGTVSDSTFSLGKRRIIATNSQTIDHLNIEAQSLLQKLHQKISLDQTKTEKIYQDLNQVTKDLEQVTQTCINDRQVQQTLRTRKDIRKNQFSASIIKIQSISQQLNQQLADFHERLQTQERELDREKFDRQKDWAKLIDQFQQQIVTFDKHLKALRSRQQPIFQQLQVNIYTLQKSVQDKIDNQTRTRNQQHSTIIHLISQSIQNLKLIY